MNKQKKTVAPVNLQTVRPTIQDLPLEALLAVMEEIVSLIRQKKWDMKEEAKMNKSELFEHVADATGVAKEQVEKVINSTIGVIQETLAAGEQVLLVGFGSFSVTERAARMGRNPRTGEAIQIAANRVPHFKPGQTLRAAVALKVVDAPKATIAPVAVEATKSKKGGKKKK